MRLPKLLASFAPETIIGSYSVSLFPDPDDGNILKPYPIITFGRRTDAPNLTYSVESSHELVNWANDVEQVSATPGPAPNMEQVVYRGLSPLSGNGVISPIFLKIRVSSGN